MMILANPQPTENQHPVNTNSYSPLTPPFLRPFSALAKAGEREGREKTG